MTLKHGKKDVQPRTVTQAVKMKGSHVEECPGGLTQETEQVGQRQGLHLHLPLRGQALSEEHILARLLIQGKEIPLPTT